MVPIGTTVEFRAREREMRERAERERRHAESRRARTSRDTSPPRRPSGR
ncbi:MAG: hypothetical protein U0V56_05560 [Actinomycetota bacterium]